MPNARTRKPRGRRTVRLTAGAFGTVTLAYWFEDGGYGGQLREVPEVIGQGRTFASLRRNILSGLGTWRRYAAEVLKREARKPGQNAPPCAEEGIREGLADLAAGRVRGFKTAKALIADLHRNARRKTRAR